LAGDSTTTTFMNLCLSPEPHRGYGFGDGADAYRSGAGSRAAQKWVTGAALSNRENGWGPLSNPRVPLVAAVFPVAALALANPIEPLDELDAAHVLRGLVAELTLDAQAKRRAVRHG